MDAAEEAGLHPFAREADAISGAALVAHLRDDTRFGGGGAEGAHLGDAATERLLHVEMFALTQDGHPDGVVHEVGHADHDGVDLVGHLGEHFAVVVKPTCVGETCEGAGGHFVSGNLFASAHVVDVAERHDLFALQRSESGLAATADADEGDLEAPVGGLRSIGSAGSRAREEERAGG